MEAIANLRDFATRRERRLRAMETEMLTIEDLLAHRSAHAEDGDAALHPLDVQLRARLSQLSVETLALREEQSRLSAKMAHLEDVFRLDCPEGDCTAKSTAMTDLPPHPHSTANTALYLHRKGLEDHIGFGLNTGSAQEQGGDCERRKGASSTLERSDRAPQCSAFSEDTAERSSLTHSRALDEQKASLPPKTRQSTEELLASDKCLESRMASGCTPAPQREFRHRSTKALEDHFAGHSMIVDNDDVFLNAKCTRVCTFSTLYQSVACTVRGGNEALFLTDVENCTAAVHKFFASSADTVILENTNMEQAYTLSLAQAVSTTSYSTWNLTFSGLFAEDTLASVPAVFPQLTRLVITSNNAGNLPRSSVKEAFGSQVRSLHLSNLDGAFSLTGGFLAGLKDLSRLDIISTSLAEIPSDAFRDNPKLDTIDLSNNKISRIGEGATANLTLLFTLTLDMNEIAELPDDFFTPLTSLTIVSIRTNRLEVLSDTAGLGGCCSHLVDIDLTENALTSFGATVFQNLSSLVAIYLGSNNLEEVYGGSFAGSTGLRLLNMTSNRIERIAEDAFASGLSGLQSLSLKNALRTSVLPANVFLGMESLLLLDLSPNELKSLPPSIGNLTALFYLDASENRLTSVSGIEFPSSLSFLNVSGNRQLVDAVTLLQQFPNMSTLDISETMASSTPACGELLFNRSISMLRAAGVDGTQEATSALFREVLVCLPNISFVDLSGNPGNTLLGSAAALASIIKDHLYLVHLYSGDNVGPPSQLQLGDQSPVICFFEQSRLVVPLASMSLPSLHYACACNFGHRLGVSGVCERVPTFWQPWRIALLVCGVSLGTLLVALIAVKVLQRMRRAAVELEMRDTLIRERTEEVNTLKRAWEISPHEIELEARVDGESQGAFGEVWRAKWEGITIAVKLLKDRVMAMDDKAVEEFHHEVEFMQKARHPNLVRFFGAGQWLTGAPFLVVELVVRGSLKSFLRGGGGAEDAVHGDEEAGGCSHGHPRPVVSWEQKRAFSLDIAQGMAYIHSLNQMHRDLKSGNVLVTEKLRAKIADFGTVRLLQTGGTSVLAASTVRGKSAQRASGAAGGPEPAPSGDLSDSTEGTHGSAWSASSADMTCGVGTPLYMSPEVMRGSEYNQSADVWSFGVLLWEIAAQESPDLLVQENRLKGPTLSTLLALLEQGKQLRIEHGVWPDWLCKCISECMRLEPNRRPNFAKIVSSL